ncbi:hypothetical protein Cgig2_006744 [Carnegiea gigantea]|uniref:Uncharacterized protein n=1 Tax=Carnegiea gigantea TaxID=171969 RepID=A0A9Q1JJK3_9CARY|nr:hypothetical protein Cgig2_006744 [Carnegiea gigantea]
MLPIALNEINVGLLFPRSISQTIFRLCAQVMSLLWPRKLLSASNSPNCPRSFSMQCFLMKLRGWEYYMGGRSAYWSGPLPSFIGASLRRGSGRTEMGFWRPNSGKRPNSLDTEGAASFSDDDKQEEMADFMTESFRWHWRSATRPPRSLPDDYQDLCSRFTLSDAERAALDFKLPEMIQATFYTMLLNDTIDLGILTLEGLRWTSFEAWLSCTSRNLREAQLRQRTTPSRACGSQGPRVMNRLAGCYLRKGSVLRAASFSIKGGDEFPLIKREDMSDRRERERRTMVHFPNFISAEMAAEYVRDTFQWPLRETSAQRPNPLLADHHGLCPGVDLSVATQYPQDSTILEIVQAIFYTMVVNDIMELDLTCRLTVECMMWVMPQLNWAPIEFWLENIDCRLKRAQASRAVNPPADPASSGAPIEDSGLSVPHQVRQMSKMKSTPRIKTPDELLSKGTLKGNICSASSPPRPRIDVLPTHSNSSFAGASTSLSDEASADSSDDESSSRSSSGKASTTSSMQVEPSAPRRAVLRKRGRTPTKPVHEVVAEGFVFPGPPHVQIPKMGLAHTSRIQKLFLL